VRAVLECTFGEAREWFCEYFGLRQGANLPASNPVARWTSIRQLSLSSALVFGAEGVDGRFVRFPMRHGIEYPPVGWQKRRADNGPMTSDGMRSICETDSERALFLPSSWPVVTPDSVLVIAEGEADAIAAHGLGFVHTVGTPGKSWNPSITEDLEVLAEGFQRRVLIMDGDVELETVYKSAEPLQARVVHVPTWVSPEPGERDLNNWVLRAPSHQVRAAIKQETTYTAIRNDAMDTVIKAVQVSSELRKGQRAVIIALMQHLLTQIIPFGPGRAFGGVHVGGCQWMTTWQRLARVAGCSVQTARTCCDKLKNAGVLSWETMAGKGLLLNVHNVGDFLKLTGKSWARAQNKEMLQGFEQEGLTGFGLPSMQGADHGNQQPWR